MSKDGAINQHQRSEYRPGFLRDLGLVGRAIQLTFNPSGRSRRTELVGLIVFPQLAIGFLLFLFLMFSPDQIGNVISSAVQFLVALLILLPLPAAAARRFHDRGESGWFAFPIIPMIAIHWTDELLDWLNGVDDDLFFGVTNWLSATFAALTLLYVVLLLLPPKHDGNPYGPDPRLE